MNTIEHNPVEFENYKKLFYEKTNLRTLTTFVPNKAMPIHNWYQYTQGFSYDLIFYMSESLRIGTNVRVLDPFCGVGTTLLSCQDLGISAVGIDISPIAVFVSNTKLYHGYDHKFLNNTLNEIMAGELKQNSDITFLEDFYKKVFPEENLYKILALRDRIFNIDDKHIKDFFSLSLLSILEELSFIRKHGAHYRFMNKDNTGVINKIANPPTNVLKLFETRSHKMIADLGSISYRTLLDKVVDSPNKNIAYIGDARNLNQISTESIDFILTSPPYLNRDNYIAQHKIELVLMKLVDNLDTYKALVRNTLQSHVEAGPYEGITNPSPHVDIIIDTISKRSLSHKDVPQMIRGYFTDMYRVIEELYRVSAKGGIIALVVGNVRWSGVIIPVDTLLLHFAEEIGFTPNKIIITRYKNNSPQQMKKYGKIPVRESIVVFSKL